MKLCKQLFCGFLALTLVLGALPPVTVRAEDAITESGAGSVPETLPETVADPEPAAVPDTLPEIPNPESEAEIIVPEETDAPDEEAHLPDQDADSLGTAGSVWSLNDRVVYESESNNKRENANGFSSGDTVVGGILAENSFGDSYPLAFFDYFTFYVGTQATVSIHLLCDYSSLFFAIEDSTGKSVHIATPSRNSSGDYEYKRSVTLSAGTYYVSIYDTDSSGWYDGYYNGYRFCLEWSGSQGGQGSQGCLHTNVTVKVVEPTCTKKGHTSYTCKDCGESWLDNLVPAKHTPDESKTIVVAPTCEKDGYTEYACKLCQEVWKDNIKKASGYHTFSDDSDMECDVCGDVRTTSGSCGENATWFLDMETGTMTISGTGKMENYFELTEVPWRSSLDLIKALVVEEGISSIGFNSFHKCANLSCITLPDTLTYIGECAFQLCTALTSLSIPKGVSKFYSHAFAGCSAL